MKKHVTISAALVALVIVVVLGFSKEDGYGSYKPTPMPLPVPEGWPKPQAAIFKNNPPTKEGFLLGKKLFYDASLSKDGFTSCASCHQPFAAFSTYDHDLSHGANNRFTTRNAPALINLAWMQQYHWDGGVLNLEMQPLNPLTSPTEMDETLENVLLKLRSNDEYKPYFKAAFGDAGISSSRMLKSIAQFTGSLVSANSKYDRVQKGLDSFAVYEQKGYQLYKAHCSTCHVEPLFTDNSFRNNGLKQGKLNDSGRQSVTQLDKDAYLFKVPTLRNVQVSLPYMHDGRVRYLSDVINHYTNGIDSSFAPLDPLLKKKIVLSEKQKKELVYFLYTLTDTSFTKNKAFLPEENVVFRH